jgi:hypothetical protein
MKDDLFKELLLLIDEFKKLLLLGLLAVLWYVFFWYFLLPEIPEYYIDPKTDNWRFNSHSYPYNAEWRFNSLPIIIQRGFFVLPVLVLLFSVIWDIIRGK